MGGQCQAGEHDGGDAVDVVPHDVGPQETLGLGRREEKVSLEFADYSMKPVRGSTCWRNPLASASSLSMLSGLRSLVAIVKP